MNEQLNKNEIEKARVVTGMKKKAKIGSFVQL